MPVIPTISPEELATPWEPQTIIWRHSDANIRHKALQQEAQKPDLDYLVREVAVENPYTGLVAVTPKEVRETIEYTQVEFDIMRACGLSVETPWWHIFVDDEGKVRTLARIAIIDGTIPNLQSIVEPVENYHRAPRKGRRLRDIDRPWQYIFGRPRHESAATIQTAQPSLQLIDPEPLY